MAFVPIKITSGCVVAVILTGLLFLTRSAAGIDWLSRTSFADARRMAVIDDTLYVPTSGGLLAITDPDRPGRRYTNLSELGTVDVTDIIEAADGTSWIAGNGRLIRWSGSNTIRYPIVDNEGRLFRLMRLADDGDFLWLGSDAGLILFSKIIDGGQVQDAFQLFADLNPSPIVYDIALVGDSIWLATSSGLAAGDRTSHTALKSPANWRGYRFSEYPELGSDTIQAVVYYDGRIHIGTTAGLFRLNPSGDAFEPLSFAVGERVYQLVDEGDSLIVYAASGLGVVVTGSASAVGTPGLSSGVQSGAVYRGARWLGAKGGGLYYQTAPGFVGYPFVGLPDNDVSDVAVAPDKTLVVLFRLKGPYEQQGGTWWRWPVNVRDGGMAVQSDLNGRFYVASFGAGMYRISDTVTQFAAQNSTIQEVGGAGSNYIVCFDLAVTERYFFGAVFEPYDDTRVAVADLGGMDSLGGWTSFGVGDGIGGGLMVSVDACDRAIAVGSGLSGAYYYYYGSDPFNKSDDSVVHYYQTQPNFRYRIVSDVVRVVRFSPDGELWVGTNFGISRFDTGLESFVDVPLPAGFGPDINIIEFDGRGNVWIGAKNGLGRIDGMTGEITVYTTRNSGLIADYVTNLTFDGLSGDLYVATTSGLSVVLSTIGPPTDDVAEVYAFPNPYVIVSPEDLLNFNFAGGARLRVFTVAGELVAERPEPVWDGRNAAGEAVASGVYVFVLTDKAGNVGRGKFLLVRK